MNTALVKAKSEDLQIDGELYGDGSEQLRRKYGELCGKYKQLVNKLQRQTLENTSTYQLGLWVAQTKMAAVALVDRNAVVISNVSWRELARPLGPQDAFSSVKPDGVRRYKHLNDLAVVEARTLDQGGEGELFEREGHDQVVEIHAERVERPGRAPVTVVFVLDATERVRLERELARAREALEHQGRMRAMGELASGVAHDLNNLLGSLTLRTALLRKGDPAHVEAQEKNISAMERLLKDAAARVRCLQDFARARGRRQIGPIDLSAVVREAIEMVRAQVEERTSFAGVPVRIEASLAETAYVSGASAAELRHMFINLLLNARDAMPKGGKVRIAVERGEGAVVVTVSDEGIGIAPEHLERVFEPFFTTKGSLGTGLGLSTAHALMSELGGRITAENRRSGGAMFTLSFPTSASDEVGERVDRVSSVPRSTRVPAGQRILIVDDDAEHLQTAKAVIELEEQDVETAASGRDALERIRSGERFDLVLCDAGMPELNGWQVAEEIRAVAPSMRVYLLTGWGEQIAEDEPRRQLVTGILPKPVNLMRIRSILRPPKQANGGGGDRAE